MFDNSIEPVAPARPVTARKTERTTDWEEIPIREATQAEMRTLKSQPPEAKTDAVARKLNLYTADKRLTGTRVYFSDFQQKTEIMRATTSRITTKHDDRQTVSAMLDLAQERGWQSIRLRGSDSFKAEAWVQAQVRGIATDGYRQTNTDLQEAERRINAMAPVAQAARVPVEAKPAVTPKPAEPDRAEKFQQARAKAEQAAQAKQSGVNGKTAVWGAVEAAGKQARDNDAATAKPAQKAAATQSATA